MAEGEASGGAASSDSEDEAAGPSKKARTVNGVIWVGGEAGDTEVDRAAARNDLAYLIWKKEMANLEREQMARAVFDNTVNGVIERLGLGGEQVSEDDVENEAVSMAIRSHGLQRRPDCSCHGWTRNRLPSSSIPFHRRTDMLCTVPDMGAASTEEDTQSAERDFLSEAVSVVIQNKGLGTFVQSDSSF
ncbi:hypothetical protein AAG570_003916 [Ranatra chinensis]|uniref:Uncharacterized protein n=1 Tax=Ranatra chinensis TaxID=642074 RepID=A0ABD0Y2A3_9HEMI